MKIIFISLGICLNAQAFMPKSFSTKYTQEYKSKVSRRIKKSSGTFEYKYPSKIKFNQQKPTSLTVTSNSKKTWIYTPPFDKGDKGQVTIGQGGESLSKFFDLLTTGLKSNKDFKVTNDKKSLKTVLTPEEKVKKELGISNVEFYFNKKVGFKNIDKIILSYTDKRVVTLKLSEMNENLTFKKDHFVFDPPKNTNIVYQ